MSASLPRAHGKPFKEHAVAVRTDAGAGDGSGVRYTGRGYLYCDGCGASSITKGDLAAKAGVTLITLNRWLNREPVPQRVADAIRAQLLRVEE